MESNVVSQPAQFDNIKKIRQPNSVKIFILQTKLPLQLAKEAQESHLCFHLIVKPLIRRSSQGKFLLSRPLSPSQA